MNCMIYRFLLVLYAALCAISLSAQDSKALAPCRQMALNSPAPGVAKELSATRRSTGPFRCPNSFELAGRSLMPSRFPITSQRSAI